MNAASHLDWFRFVGRVLGKCLLEGHIVFAPLCSSLLKALLGHPLLLSDLREIDPVYHDSLHWMLSNDITGVLFETFSVEVDEFGSKRTVELVEGGEKMHVGEENKHLYVQAAMPRGPGAPHAPGEPAAPAALAAHRYAPLLGCTGSPSRRAGSWHQRHADPRASPSPRGRIDRVTSDRYAAHRSPRKPPTAQSWSPGSARGPDPIRGTSAS